MVRLISNILNSTQQSLQEGWNEPSVVFLIKEGRLLEVVSVIKDVSDLTEKEIYLKLLVVALEKESLETSLSILKSLSIPFLEQLGLEYLFKALFKARKFDEAFSVLSQIEGYFQQVLFQSVWIEELRRCSNSSSEQKEHLFALIKLKGKLQFSDVFPFFEEICRALMKNPHRFEEALELVYYLKSSTQDTYLHLIVTKTLLPQEKIEKALAVRETMQEGPLADKVTTAIIQTKLNQIKEEENRLLSLRGSPSLPVREMEHQNTFVTHHILKSLLNLAKTVENTPSKTIKEYFFVELVRELCKRRHVLETIDICRKIESKEERKNIAEKLIVILREKNSLQEIRKFIEKCPLRNFLKKPLGQVLVTEGLLDEAETLLQELEIEEKEELFSSICLQLIREKENERIYCLIENYRECFQDQNRLTNDFVVTHLVHEFMGEKLFEKVQTLCELVNLKDSVGLQESIYQSLFKVGKQEELFLFLQITSLNTQEVLSQVFTIFIQTVRTVTLRSLGEWADKVSFSLEKLVVPLFEVLFNMRKIDEALVVLKSKKREEEKKNELLSRAAYLLFELKKGDPFYTLEMIVKYLQALPENYPLSDDFIYNVCEQLLGNTEIDTLIHLICIHKGCFRKKLDLYEKLLRFNHRESAEKVVASLNYSEGIKAIENEILAKWLKKQFFLEGNFREAHAFTKKLTLLLKEEGEWYIYLAILEANLEEAESGLIDELLETVSARRKSFIQAVRQGKKEDLQGAYLLASSIEDADIRGDCLKKIADDFIRKGELEKSIQFLMQAPLEEREAIFLDGLNMSDPFISMRFLKEIKLEETQMECVSKISLDNFPPHLLNLRGVSSLVIFIKDNFSKPVQQKLFKFFGSFFYKERRLDLGVKIIEEIKDQKYVDELVASLALNSWQEIANIEAFYSLCETLPSGIEAVLLKPLGVEEEDRLDFEDKKEQYLAIVRNIKNSLLRDRALSYLIIFLFIKHQHEDIAEIKKEIHDVNIADTIVCEALAVILFKKRFWKDALLFVENIPSLKRRRELRNVFITHHFTLTWQEAFLDREYEKQSISA